MIVKPTEAWNPHVKDDAIVEIPLEAWKEMEKAMLWLGHLRESSCKDHLQKLHKILCDHGCELAEYT